MSARSTVFATLLLLADWDSIPGLQCMHSIKVLPDCTHIDAL